MALIPGRKKKEDDKQRVQVEENRITGLFNFLIFLSIVAIGYTDWKVVPAGFAGLSVRIAHCPQRTGEPAGAYQSSGLRLRGSRGPLLSERLQKRFA